MKTPIKRAAHAPKREPQAAAMRLPVALAEVTSQTTITDWLGRWLSSVGQTPESQCVVRLVAHNFAALPPMPQGMAFLVYSPDAALKEVAPRAAEQHMWSLFALLPKTPHTWKIALHAAAYLRRLPKLNAHVLPPQQAACDFITALRLAADYLGTAADPGQDGFWVEALRRALALSLQTQGLALGEGFALVDAEFLSVLEANMLSDLQWHLGLASAHADEEATFFAQVEAAPVMQAAQALAALDASRAASGVGLSAWLQAVKPR